MTTQLPNPIGSYLGEETERPSGRLGRSIRDEEISGGKSVKRYLVGIGQRVRRDGVDFPLNCSLLFCESAATPSFFKRLCLDRGEDEADQSKDDNRCAGEHIVAIVGSLRMRERCNGRRRWTLTKGERTARQTYEHTPPHKFNNDQ